MSKAQTIFLATLFTGCFLPAQGLEPSLLKPANQKSEFELSPPLNSLAAVPDLNTRLALVGAISTAVLVPVMMFLGALVVNPQWTLLGDIAGERAKLSYIDQSLSGFTIPLAALFGVLGTAPLLGIFMKQRADNE